MLAVATMIVASSNIMSSTAQNFEYGRWSVNLDANSKKMTFAKDGENVLSGVSVRFKYNGKVYDTSEYSSVDVTNAKVADKAGDAQKYTVTYTLTDDLPKVDQTFFLFEEESISLQKLR